MKIVLGIALILLLSFTFKMVSTARKKDELEIININEEITEKIEEQKADNEILIKENILLGLENLSKEEVIEKAGRLLVDSGYVGEEYIEAMLEREKVVSTYIGNGVAIPHGVGSSKQQVKQSGIVVLQFPKGIDFGDGNIAYLIIGIAGKDNDHLKILSNIATALEDEKVVQKLVTTDDASVIYKTFTSNL